MRLYCNANYASTRLLIYPPISCLHAVPNLCLIACFACVYLCIVPDCRSFGDALRLLSAYLVACNLFVCIVRCVHCVVCCACAFVCVCLFMFFCAFAFDN